MVWFFYLFLISDNQMYVQTQLHKDILYIEGILPFSRKTEASNKSEFNNGGNKKLSKISDLLILYCGK